MADSQAEQRGGRHLERPRSVVFDCDSTLVAIEGITWLASAHRDEIAALTDAAMSGAIPLEEVYGRRLDVVRPDRSRMQDLGNAYVDALVPDARETVEALREAGINVYIVSGGVRPAVEYLASALGIAPDHVEAVGMRFDANGAYSGFDSESALARSNGKRDVIENLDPPPARPLWLVGDGKTDLEARPAVDAFIAFTGVARHDAVAAQADAIVSTRSLAPVLALALGDARPVRGQARDVYDRGRSILGITS
jgi:phosphoserine phosphatase